MNRLENIYKKILENDGKIFNPTMDSCVGGDGSCVRCPISSIKTKLKIETNIFYNCAMEKDRKIIVETIKQMIRKIRLEKLLS